MPNPKEADHAPPTREFARQLRRESSATMSIRNERRRRLIADDPNEESSDESGVRIARPATGADDSASRPYALTTERQRSRALDALFPSRLLTIWLIALAGLMLTGGLVIVHLWAVGWSDRLATSELVLLDLDSSRNLSRWFASTLLGFAAAIAMFIFSLRRHRLDDYHGRYRVWLWALCGCLMASLGETTSAGEVAEGLCNRASEACGLNAQVAWPATVGLVLLTMGARLLVEVWRSRAAVAALSAAGICLLAAGLVEFGDFSGLADAYRSAVCGGCRLAGDLLVLTAFLLYTRHVVREIEGLVPVLVRRKKRRSSETSQSDQKSRAADSPQKPGPKLRTDLDPVQTAETRSPKAAALDDEDEDEPATARGSDGSMSAGHAGLSRAERRRLRRESARKAS
jgi:hypothetical protein